MKTFFLALAVFFVSWPVSAQQKTIDKKFIFTSSFLVGGTVFDVESTVLALEKCVSCREGNFLMRPFIESGRPATYLVEGALDAGVVYFSYKLKKEGNKWWWVAPVIGGVIHTTVGGFNLRFVL